MNRKLIAALVAVVWLAGIGWLVRRSVGGDINRRLAEAAIRIQPATYYYRVSFDGEMIGAASSAVDTLASSIIADDYYTGRSPEGDSSGTVSVRLHTRLSRSLHLAGVSLRVTRGSITSASSASIEGDTTLIVTGAAGKPGGGGVRVLALHSPVIGPTLAGVALMLGTSPKVGAEEVFSVYNPARESVDARSVKIVAESLFTVADSAARDRSGAWSVAHTDTVRAWELGGDTDGLRMWVDGEGRVVSGSAPNGLRVVRTAFELAFERGKKQ